MVTKELKNSNPIREREERTALSVLIGLRQKFAKESKSNEQNYTSSELYSVLSELLKKVNKGILDIYQFEKEIKRCESNNPIWNEINGLIERSKIKRYNWNSILGCSLTKEILLKKKEGLDAEQTYQIFLKDERVKSFIDQYPREERKFLDNLRISVYARYGESQTEEKILFDNDN